MKQKPRRRYTAEFKSQAIELLKAGRPVPELAEEHATMAPTLTARRCGLPFQLQNTIPIIWRNLRFIAPELTRPLGSIANGLAGIIRLR